jgi:hypothetical protein
VADTADFNLTYTVIASGSWDSSPVDSGSLAGRVDQLLPISLDFETRFPTATLAVLSTSDDGSDGNVIALGERVVFRIRATIPKGTSSFSFNLFYSGPSVGGAVGLSHVISRVSSQGNEMRPDFTTQNATESELAGSPSNILLSLASLRNSVGAGSNDVVLDFTFVPRAFFVANDEGTILSIGGAMQFGSFIVDLSALTITLGEPALAVVRTFTAPGALVDAGDVIPHRIVVSPANSPSVPAYAVLVSDTTTDLLQANLSSALCVPDVSCVFSGGPSGFNVTYPRQLRDVAVTVTWDYVVVQTVRLADDLLNTGRLFSSYSTHDNLDSPARVYETTLPYDGSAIAGVRDPSFSWQILSSTLRETDSPLYNIHEGIVIRARFQMPEIVAFVTLNITVDSLLVPENEVSSVTHVGNIGPQLVAPIVFTNPEATTFSFSLGDLTNAFDNIDNSSDGGSDVLELDFSFNVDLLDSVVRGSSVTFSAQAQFDDFLPDSPSTLSIQVSEPSLTLDHSFITTTPSFGNGRPDGDDILRFTNVIRHAGTSNGPAYDLVLVVEHSDNVATFSTFTCTGCAGLTQITPSGSGSTVTITIPVLDSPTTLTITYTGVLDPNVEPETLVNSTAVLDYDSADVGLPGRVYPTESDSASILSATTPTPARDVSTSLADTSGTRVTIGEVITFVTTITFPEGRGNLALSLREFLFTSSSQSQMEPVDAHVTAFGSSLTADNLGNIGAAGTINPANLTFTFGNMINQPDNVANVSDQIVISWRFTPRASAGNSFIRFELVLSTQVAPIAVGSSFTIVQPRITYDASLARIGYSGDAGDEFAFSMVFSFGPYTRGQESQGFSNSDAYNFSVTYNLDEKLLLIPGAASCVYYANESSLLTTAQLIDGFSCGALPSSRVAASTITAKSITFRVDKLEDVEAQLSTVPDEVFHVYVLARVLDQAVPRERIFANMTFEAFSSPDISPAPRVYGATEIIDAFIDAVVVTVSFAGSSDVVTNEFEVTVDEDITLDVSFQMPEGQTSTVFEMAVPDNLEAKSGTVSFLGANIQNSALAVNDTLTISPTLVSADFGTLLNAFDNVNTTSDLVRVCFVL